MGDTTFTGLRGLGRTKGGGALTGGEEGREELIFSDCSGGFEGRGVGVTTVLDWDVTGEIASFGEVNVEAMVEAILGALFWTGLGGGTVTEEETTGSCAVGTVFITATAGVAPPAVRTDTDWHKNYNVFVYRYYRFLPSWWLRWSSALSFQCVPVQDNLPMQ